MRLIYGLLKCKYSCTIRTNKERNIYMILKNITEKLKTALSLVLAVLQVGLSYGMHLWKMVQSFIVSQLRLLFNVIMNHRVCSHIKDLMNWNFGIAFSYYPAITTYDILTVDNTENT